MPQSGFCVDSRCAKEIRRLYECHCCLRLICLTHLNEHEEKEKVFSLTQQLRTKIDFIESTISNRLKLIEREREFVQQANRFLDGRTYSIAEIEKILQGFNQLVQEHCLRKKIFTRKAQSIFSSFRRKHYQN